MKMSYCPYSLQFLISFVNIYIYMRISFEFGFWSLYVPQQQFKNVPYFDQEFDDNQLKDGQFLFQDSQHNAQQRQQQKIRFQIYPTIYERKWVLNVLHLTSIIFIFFLRLQIKLNIVKMQQISQFIHKFSQEGEEKQQCIIARLNLNNYKGRLSKILIGNEEFYFWILTSITGRVNCLFCQRIINIQ
ncbi:unnamed protein product [Paramecium pentaurelia]|uniref:Transmembrane protein n=1 Tax=Paramecium pentaurelia TaxID=43138 RepID=A0A8S1VZE1_9CILI|nr:unnamed protein product [Paramecium pentaurelia]